MNADVNVALGRPATQSSTFTDPWAGIMWPNRSVDGNFNTNIYYGSCSNTSDPPGGPNWWMVDLGQPLHLTHVVITNRDEVDFGKTPFRQ